MNSSTPLKVFYPHGGYLVMLHWWTYDERGHLIMAPTIPGVVKTAKTVFAKHDDAEIRDYCAIEVVGPSEEMVREARRFDMREEIDTFHHVMISRVRDLLKAGRPLPPPFEVCKTYRPDAPEDDDSDDYKNEWAVESHYGCRDCKDKIRLVGLTPAELHEKFYKAWEAAHPSPSYSNPKLVPSRARPAVDRAPLWYAEASFGDHHAGISLAKVDYNEFDSNMRPSFLEDRVLFFFRRGVDLDKTGLEAYVADMKASRHARRHLRENERILKRRQEEEDDLNATYHFFAGVQP